jgi:hypothetical protein
MREKLKLKLHNIGTGSAAALFSRRLCYRPAVFFRNLHFIAFSLLQGRIRIFTTVAAQIFSPVL